MFAMLDLEDRDLKRTAKRAAKEFTMAELQEKCRQAEADDLEELACVFRLAIYYKD